MSLYQREFIFKQKLIYFLEILITLFTLNTIRLVIFKKVCQKQKKTYYPLNHINQIFILLHLDHHCVQVINIWYSLNSIDCLLFRKSLRSYQKWSTGKKMKKIQIFYLKFCVCKIINCNRNHKNKCIFKFHHWER